MHAAAGQVPGALHLAHHPASVRIATGNIVGPVDRAAIGLHARAVGYAFDGRRIRILHRVAGGVGSSHSARATRSAPATRSARSARSAAAARAAPTTGARVVSATDSDRSYGEEDRKEAP